MINQPYHCYINTLSSKVRNNKTEKVKKNNLKWDATISTTSKSIVTVFLTKVGLFLSISILGV